MPKQRTILTFMIGLIFLAGIAWLAGWGLHAWVSKDERPSPSPSIKPSPSTEPPTPSPHPATGAPAPSPSPMPKTSTPAPTSVPLPSPPSTIRVKDREGLYRVCRRHCLGRFDESSVEPELKDYADRVADYNGLPKEPTLLEGQELRMLPCPER